MAAGIQSLDRSLRDSARFRLTRRVGPVLVLLILVHPGTLAEVWPGAADYSLVLGNFLWLPLTIGLGILALCVFIEVLVDGSRSDGIGAGCCMYLAGRNDRRTRGLLSRTMSFLSEEDRACLDAARKERRWSRAG